MWHQAIAKAEPVRHELAWGWVIHYAIGVLFAMLLISMAGESWLQAPTCFMQPVMGAGFFASKSPASVRNCLKSLVTHIVFGVGLFLSAAMIACP